MSAPSPLRKRLLAFGAGTLAAALLAAAAWQGYAYVVAQPVKRVIFAGETDRLPHADLDALAAAVQAAPGAPLASIRESARRVPWVRDATVRRRFPDALEIRFTAQSALARWDDERLVSASGEIFRGEAANLPRFRGPEGSAALMVREHAAIAAALAPLGDAVAELRLSQRGAWTAVMASGLTLKLGRGDVRPRLERFAAAWPRLAEQGPAPQYVDLRYPNGFAARRAAVVTVVKNPKK